MKKLLSISLVLTMLLSMTACKTNNEPTDEAMGGTVVEENLGTDVNEEVSPSPEAEATTAPTKTPEATNKPTSTPTSKPVATEKPQETKKTMGQTLLSAFKAQSASKSTGEIANALISNPIIQFMGGINDVEPGYLSGFTKEIHGFKKATMFGPMMGSIAFVGYVFELPDGANASSFISELKSCADMRWNICVEAEEMVTASSGNKVFFLMCPKNMDNPQGE